MTKDIQEQERMATRHGAVLPDRSPFFTMCPNLPEDHWIYESVKNGRVPYLSLSLCRRNDAKVNLSARFRRAIIRATDHGRAKDFDPDALVQLLLTEMIGRDEDAIARPSEN